MNQELKDAIHIIAEYDGNQVKIRLGKIAIGTPFFINGEKYYKWEEEKYTTCANTLLNVWRKINDILTKEMNKMFNDENDDKEFPFIEHDIVGKYILLGNLPEACLKLAQIIKQLNQQP